MRKSIVFPVATFLVAVAGMAIASPSAIEAEMEARLKELYPSTRITAVRQSEVTGLYEVTMGRNVAFTDGSGRYFVFGHLFDMREQKDRGQIRVRPRDPRNEIALARVSGRHDNAHVSPGEARRVQACGHPLGRERAAAVR